MTSSVYIYFQNCTYFKLIPLASLPHQHVKTYLDVDDDDFRVLFRFSPVTAHDIRRGGGNKINISYKYVVMGVIHSHSG